MPTYTFAGLADGAAWPTPWTVSTATNGTATVQSAAGELKTGNAGGWTWLDQVRVNHGAVFTDVDVTFTMWVGGTDRTPHFYLRNPGNSPDSDARRVEIKFEEDGVSVFEVEANTPYALGTKLAATPYAAPTKARVRVEGTTLQLKVWAASAAEPSTWGRSLTLTAHTAASGSVGFFVVGSGTAAHQFVYVDNVTITDLAAQVGQSFVVMSPVGPPAYPGVGVRVLSPNPSPVADPSTLTGTVITVGQGDDPEALVNGTVHPAGTVIRLARGAVWTNKRLIVQGAGTVSQPVLVCASAGTGPLPVIESVTKAGRFKDDGVIVTTGTHVHVRDVVVRDSLSVAFRPEATNGVLSAVEAGDTVIGAWIAGNGTRMWNSYVYDQHMMPDTPGTDDDYGSVGAVIEAHDVTIEGLTARNCLTETGTDYDVWGGDGGFVEIWMKGDNARVQYGYADKTLRLVEGGGLGPTSTARNMRYNNIYLTQVGTDDPIYFNPVGPYAGLDVTGLQSWDNVVVPWVAAPPVTPSGTTFAGLPDGSPWPAPWVASTVVNGTVTVQSETGRLLSGAAGGWTYLDQARVNYPAASTPPNFEAAFTMWVGGTDRTPHFYFRNPGDTPDSETRRVLVKYESDGVSVVEVEANTEYPLGTKLPLTPYTGATRTRIRVDGAALKLRVWPVEDPEPATWGRELTLTAHTSDAGSLGFFLVGSGVAVAQPMYVNDVTITDLNPTASTVELTAPATVAVGVGQPYSHTLTTVVGDSSAVTYTADVLPAGVTLSPFSGVVSGTPTTAGTVTTTWTATSSTGASDTAVTVWTVSLAPAATSFTGLANGVPWPSPWTASTVVNGTATAFNETGQLRTGATGGWAWTDQVRVNYGATPANVDVTFTMWVGGTDRTPHLYLRNAGNSPDSETRRVEIKFESDGVAVREINANVGYPLGTKLPFTPYAAPFKVRAQVVGTALKLRVWAASASEPSTWGRELTLTGHTSPTGSLGFFVVGSGVAANQFVYVDDITVTSMSAPTPSVTVTAPATRAAIVGQPIPATVVSATTNDASTVTYTADVLPAGLTLNTSTGAVTGTPTTVGTVTTTWTATSSTGATGTATTAWTVATLVTVTVTAPAALAATVGVPILLTLTSSTGDGATVTYTADTLPAGVTLNPATGAVSGTPTTAGTVTTVWTGTSTSGATDDATTVWTVSAAPAPPPPPVRKYAPPRPSWSYFATTVNGDGTETLIAGSLPLTGVQIVDPVSAACELTFDLTPEIARLQRPDGRPVIRARSTAVYAEIDGVIRGGGIVTGTTADGPTLKVVCQGFSSLIDGEPWTNRTLKIVNADPADVVRIIWSYWQAHPRANIPLELPAGLKTSGKVGTAAEPLLLANYATSDLGDVFYDMLEAGPMDFRERSWWDGDLIRHRLDLGHARLGRRRTDLSFHVGTNVVEIPSVGFDQERYASEIIVLGAGEGDKMTRAHAYNKTADRLRRVKVVPSKGIGLVPTAQLFAEKWAQNFSGDERDVEELVVIDHTLAPLFSWDPGDEVWLSGDSMWGGQLGVWVRILSTSVTPDRSSTAALKVARADKVI